MNAARRTVVALVPLLIAAAAHAQLQITSEDGAFSLKFGLMTQLQARTLETADGDSTAKDLYFRRLRLLAGGKLGERWSFFLETDSPNLGLGTADGSKSQSDVYIQDFIVTYTFSDMFHLDAGLILTPNAYNSEQSAAALLPVDYGPYSFLASGPTTSNVGRDYGVQARGYLADSHFEYRAGVYQGARGDNSTAPFRTVARVVWYPFEAQKGYFYTGTSLGKKKIVGVGASIDHQDDYSAYGADVFVDWPVNGGDGVTVQADWLRYDGGSTFTQLPEQDTMLLEAGYYLHSVHLSPFVQYATRDFAAASRPDESKLQAGVAWWLRGHNLNLKLGVGTLSRDGYPDRNLAQLQLQVFVF